MSRKDLKEKLENLKIGNSIKFCDRKAPYNYDIKRSKEDEYLVSNGSWYNRSMTLTQLIDYLPVLMIR